MIRRPGARPGDRIVAEAAEPGGARAARLSAAARRPRAGVALASGLWRAACAAAPARSGLAAAGPVFSPQAFFTGATVGEGTLRVALSRGRPIRVAGSGRVEPDGTLVLVQRIEQAGRRPRTRTWRLRPLDGTRFTGTLTDAVGPVRAKVQGNRLHIRFTARGGLGVEQWLFLQPGGQVALNRMAVRKFGIPVASLRETIRRSS